MYCTIYTSSDNEEIYNNPYFYPYFDIVSSSNIKTNDLCIICWSNLYNNDGTELLQNHVTYTLYCNCNPSIHTECLYKWYLSTKSCPICRKIIVHEPFNSDIARRNLTLLSYLIILYTYVVKGSRIVKILAFINMLIIFFYNFYFFYYFTYKYYNFDQVL
jgi:hypothetical protein